MHFCLKHFTFSFNFQLTISFLFIIWKLWMKTNLFFCIRYTTHQWKEKKRKTHAQDVIPEELNTVNAKNVSYTKLKSTVGFSTELSDSLKKLQTQKNQLEKGFREKISDMQSQGKLREKKAKILQQLQREHLNAASAPKKLTPVLLKVTPGQVGRPLPESRMMGLHQTILRYSSS